MENAQGAAAPVEKIFVIVDIKNKIVHSSTKEQEMIDICMMPESHKKRYRMIEATVTRIHVFGAFDSEKSF